MKTDINTERDLMKSQINSKSNVCRYSPFRAWILDNGIRRLFQNPTNIVGPYVKEGMIAIDIGCGPGMFTIAMAVMVGDTGKVMAVDLQQEMLDLVKKKSEQRNLDSRIQFHRNGSDSIGLSEKADFILSFFMVHEVPDRDAFLREVHGLLKQRGKYLVVEPKFHVSPTQFKDTIDNARRAGFKPVFYPRIRWSRAVLFTRSD